MGGEGRVGSPNPIQVLAGTHGQQSGSLLASPRQARKTQSMTALGPAVCIIVSISQAEEVGHKQATQATQLYLSSLSNPKITVAQAGCALRMIYENLSYEQRTLRCGPHRPRVQHGLDRESRRLGRARRRRRRGSLKRPGWALGKLFKDDTSVLMLFPYTALMSQQPDRETLRSDES